MKGISDIFKALSEDARLRIFGMLADGREVCVCRFSQILKSTHSKTSRHLAYLKRNALVTSVRKGQWMYYRLNPRFDAAYSALLDATRNLLGASAQAKKDLKKLEELDKLENCSHAAKKTAVRKQAAAKGERNER